MVRMGNKMEKIRTILEYIFEDGIEQIVLSNSIHKEKASKIKIRPVLIQDKLLYQETMYQGTQVFHTNYEKDEIIRVIIKYMKELFKQAQIAGFNTEATILISKNGKVTIKKKDRSLLKKENSEYNHNRTKKYILQEGEPVDFLIGLGVQSKDGTISKNRYDKFRQINRFLEFIEDILEELPKNKRIHIVDFGCGKSYLTFAMYYYLHILQKRDIQITGLDLKKDVIEKCNVLAKTCHYEQLYFEVGDISSYGDGSEEIDMVVSLHACDTATDYALEKAIKWNAKVIMAVPCCQHEVNKQLKCEELNFITKYGLLKEKISALFTDALRANLLEEQGYNVQIVEFIDLEHTPKNIMIRAVKKDGMRPIKKEIAPKASSFLNVETTLQKLLKEPSSI